MLKLGLFSTTTILRRPPCAPLIACQFHSSRNFQYRNPGSQMNWSASVLSTASSDTEPTVILTFDNAKYIFNAGENTNRAFLQSRRNWKRTRGIFVTQVGTQRASGLPGLLMSFADATITRLDIVGPPGIIHFLAAMRMYTFRDTILINPIETSWNTPTASNPGPVYTDENIIVYSFPVLPASENAPLTANETQTPPPDDTQNPELVSKRKRESSPDLPQKRRSTATGIQQLSGSLRSSITGPDFSPATLEREDAEEWRNLMVHTMFPGTHVPVKEPHPPQVKKVKGEKGKKSSDTKSAPIAPPPVAELDVGPPSSKPPTNIDDYRRSRARLPTGFHQQLPKFSSSQPRIADPPTSSATAYIVVGPRIRGKFDVEKAKALGVFGKHRGLLTKGETVTFKVRENGKDIERTVRPEECLGASETPGVVVILDVPSPAHIPSLIASFADSPLYRRFRSKQPEDNSEYAVRTVFHLLGKGVAEDERYVDFMNGFTSDAHHIMSSREHSPNPVTFTSSAYNQLRLNQLDSVMFPVAKYSLTPAKKLTDIPNIPSNIHIMSSNMVINMRPPGPPSRDATADDTDRFHPLIIAEEPITLSEGASQRFAKARENVEAFVASGTIDTPKGTDVGVLPLGTGSALPSKYRNVSSTLIQIPDWGNVLLDAGEGTWGQLCRQFGDDESSSPNVWDILRDLKCIFVSHIHGDHHMGLAQILAKRRLLPAPLPDPLYLVSVRGIHLYLRELSDLQDFGLDDRSSRGVIPIMSEALHWRKGDAYQTVGMWQVGGDEPWTDIHRSHHHAADMCTTLGLERFETVDVYHRTRAYGSILTHTDGWSIVFSGDTMPTDNLVYAGRNATLLIHEATMADDQLEMARKKAHSTFGQAVDVGRRMSAEHILLTHFSARYPKMPPSYIPSPADIKNSSRKEPVVALAFDHANMTIGTMWKMNYYLPALEKSFADTAEEEGDEEEAEPSEVMQVD